MSTSTQPLPVRGLLWGLGYGASVSTVHLVIGMVLILALGMPPLTWFAIKAVGAELLLGAVLGLLASPLLLAGDRGKLLHPAVLALVWLGMERWVAVDPSKPQMWLAPPLVALVVMAVGYAVGKRWPRQLIGGVLLLDVVLLLLPIVRHAVVVDEGEVLADRPDPAADMPDVLFIVMDTVRAQSSSTYGYERETTPVLTELAAEGVRFDQASAPATWSLPAHASLFTGTFPSVHNAHGETRYLDDKLPTLAEVFQGSGYETRCFSANPHISASFGLVRGFDSCDKAWSTGSGGRQFTFMYRLLDQLGLGGVDDKGGSMVVGNIERWMQERSEGDRPAFVFVNFLEAHFPFHQLPEEYLYAFHDRPIQELRDAGQIAFGVQFGRQLTDPELAQIQGPLVDMYDGGVLYTDALVGRVLDVWRDKGLLDDTLVVVLADHGEVVGEHKAFGHVSAVVEEDLRVPMVVRYPGKVPAGQVVSHPVSTAGVMATITELAGVETPDTVLVGNLMGALTDPEVGKPVIAERYEEHMLADRFEPGTANGVGPLVNPRGRYRTYRSGPYKLVQHSDDGTFLFHLELGEGKDLAADQPEKVSELEQELLQISMDLKLPSLGVEIQQVARAEQTDEEILSLCQLGYLEGLICECARGSKSGPECDCARGKPGAECP